MFQGLSVFTNLKTKHNKTKTKQVVSFYQFENKTKQKQTKKDKKRQKKPKKAKQSQTKPNKAKKSQNLPKFGFAVFPKNPKDLNPKDLTPTKHLRREGRLEGKMGQAEDCRILSARGGRATAASTTVGDQQRENSHAPALGSSAAASAY